MKVFLIFIALLVVSTSCVNLLILVDSGASYFYLDDTIVQLKTVNYIENVTAFDPSTDTPTLEFLTDFDCVLVIGAYNDWHDSNALGSVLVKYMSQTRGGVITALDYYYYQNEVIGGEFEPYNYFRGWYPQYASSHLIKTPNNTNSYAFNTSNLYVSYHLTLTADQMYGDPQILFEIENEDEPDRPYIGMVSKSLNFGGMPAVRTDFNFRIYAPNSYFPYGYETNDTLLLITDAIRRTSRPCVTQCLTSFNISADDSCMAKYPPFACDSVEQLSTGSVAGVGAFTLKLKIDGTACNSTMNVIDTTPPILQCPGDFALIADHCNVTVPEITGVNVTDNCDATVESYTQSPAAGSIIGIGVNKITVSATDVYGNVGTCIVQITVTSSQAYTEPPTLYCPTQFISPMPDYACGGLVQNYDGSINATDECGVLISWSQMYQVPYPEYPVINGSLLITIYATDDFNNTNYCEFLQISMDQTPPEGYCGSGGVKKMPTFLELDEQCSAQVGNVPAFFYDNCAEDNLPYFQSPNASDLVYGVGTVNVTTWAVDTSGNIGYCYVDIITYDSIPPSIDCPTSLITIHSALVPDLSLYVNSSDNCNNTTFNQTLEIGSILTTLGKYDIEISVWDQSGNYASCNVTVNFQPPNVTCPSAYTLDADSNCAARIPYVEVDPYFTAVQYPTANSTVSRGVTSLNVTVTAPGNHSTYCITTVTVLDKIAPSLTCVDHIAVTNNTQVPDVKNLVTYSDACGNVTWQQIPEAGAVVAIGNHTLNVTVTDTSGNTATCVIFFQVEEGAAETPVVTPIQSSSSGGGGIGPGAIAGIVIGALIGLCLIIGLIVALIWWRKREKKEEAFFSVELVPSGGGPKSTGVFKAK